MSFSMKGGSYYCCFNISRGLIYYCFKEMERHTNKTLTLKNDGRWWRKERLVLTFVQRMVKEKVKESNVKIVGKGQMWFQDLWQRWSVGRVERLAVCGV